MSTASNMARRRKLRYFKPMSDALPPDPDAPPAEITPVSADSKAETSSGAAPDWAEAAEQRTLDEALKLVHTHHWNKTLVEAAAEAAGLSKSEAELVFPYGARDLSALLSRRHDAVALKALGQSDASKLKVRERIHAGVEARIEAAMADEEATRKSGAFLALPPNMPLGARLLWESADKLWRWAGDTATDENHYTKRLILSTVLASTLAARMAGGHEHARKHLAGRIDHVMKFEKFKASAPFKPVEAGKTLAGILGALRYGPAKPRG